MRRLPIQLLPLLAAALLTAPSEALGDETRPDLGATSPRLFEMPVADVVGPYQASLSYDGSLLEEPGILASAGVAALGIGDLAQVEYRHTSAIGVRGGNVPLPAVGVQFKLPFARKSRVPAIALAYRLGVEHFETLRGTDYLEKATDIYLVSRIKLPASFDVHLGLRMTSALFEGEQRLERTLYLPALGITRKRGNTTAVMELGRAPRFVVDANDNASIEHGFTGRLGLRWRLHPSVSLDASAGTLAKESGVTPSEVLQWDIRFGGEVFVNWGQLACTSISVFCQ